jgi:hypothetical protein
MAYWVDGIERPIKEQIEEHDRLIRKHTLRFSDDDLDSADSFDMLQDVLAAQARCEIITGNFWREGVQNPAEMMLIHPMPATGSARYGNL